MKKEFITIVAVDTKGFPLHLNGTIREKKFSGESNYIVYVWCCHDK
jgi:hypothetical protein